MKCPFVDRDCIGRECAAWSNGMCFVENFTQKLDTLCNLISKLSVDLSNKSSSSKLKLNEFEQKIVPKVKEKAVIDEKVTKISPPIWQPITGPVSVGESILAVDFGTALSKVAIRRSSEYSAIPVPLATVASKILDSARVEAYIGENEFLEDSIIYIDDDCKVLCGNLARDRYLKAAVSGNRRPAIQNLKQFLIGGGTKIQLHNSCFPTSEKLTTQEVLATYLAYLFHLTRSYLGHGVDLRIDLDATVINFSIPVWEDKKYREEVKEIVKGAISKGFCLEKWLKEELVLGVPLPRLREALEQAKQIESETAAIIGADVTEPVAAGYSRVNDLQVEPGWPAQLFIIDAGAGSTDFSLLTISRPKDNKEKLKIFTSMQGGVGKGVGMWDNALRSLLYNQLKETSGATPEQPEFQIFSARLEAQLRSLKENVVSSTDTFPIDVHPVLTTPILISRDDLEASEPVRETISAIGNGFQQYIIEVKERVAEDKFDPSLTEFLVTGGGSFIPLIVECIRECTRLFGPSYAKKVVHRYSPPAYEKIPNFINVYPMLAVSLGSTEREYPREQMIPPISPDPGPFEIGGYYTKGI